LRNGASTACHPGRRRCRESRQPAPFNPTTVTSRKGRIEALFKPLSDDKQMVFCETACSNTWRVVEVYSAEELESRVKRR
jgi:hypothetical protein